jgi:preprotein translocase subunit YajC
VWNLILAQAQEAAQQTSTATGAEQTPRGTANPFSNMLFLLVAMVAIMYFLMIRPNQKREKDRREMMAALAKGDKVVTSGGICGSVVGLSEKTVVLRISDDPAVKVEFLRGAISQVTSRAGQDKE